MTEEVSWPELSSRDRDSLPSLIPFQRKRLSRMHLYQADTSVRMNNFELQLRMELFVIDASLWRIIVELYLSMKPAVINPSL